MIDSSSTRHLIWCTCRHRYDAAEALLIVIATGMALAITNSIALDVVGWQINPWIVLAATAVELGTGILFLLRRHLVQIDLRIPEFVAYACIVLFTTAYIIYPSLPGLIPPSHHFDAVHHIVLADYIFETLSLPHDFSGAVRPYFPPGYPVGGAVAVALASHWFGSVPITTLHPFISLVLGLTAGLLFVIARRLLNVQHLATPLASLAILLLFTGWAYFPGAINDRYFFGQVFAQFFALLVFFYLMDYAHNPDLLSLLLILSALAVVLFSHPSPMPAAALAVAVVLIFRLTCNRVQSIGHGILLALGMGLAVLFYVVPRWNAWVGQTGYGESAPISIESTGVFLPILGAIGFALALQGESRARVWIAFLMLAAVLAQPVTLFIMRFFVPSIGMYYFEKSVYLLIYPAALFAAVTLEYAARRVESFTAPRALTYAAWAICTLSIPLIFTTFPPRPFAPLTRSELEVARWARANIDIDNLACVSPIREDAYWIRVAVFQQSPSAPASVAAYNIGSMTYEEWRGNPGEPNYALVRNLARIPNDPTVRIVYQYGESGILYKSPTAILASPSPQRETQFQFGDMFRLVGYDIPEQWIPDSDLKITFYWQPLRWPTQRMSMFVQILDRNGDVVARSENEMFQGRFPTQRWHIGVVTPDVWTVPLDKDMAPGEYTIEVAIFPKLGGQRLSVIQPNAESAEGINLGPFRVIIPAPSPDELRAAQRINAQFGDSIALYGYTINSTIIRPGESLRVILYWQSLTATTEEYTVFVHLLDAAGHVRAQVDVPPQNGMRPTNTWHPNEVLKDPYLLILPKDLPSGKYQIEVGLYTPSDLKRVPVAGSDHHIILPQTITIP